MRATLLLCWRPCCPNWTTASTFSPLLTTHSWCKAEANSRWNPAPLVAHPHPGAGCHFNVVKEVPKFWSKYVKVIWTLIWKRSIFFYKSWFYTLVLLHGVRDIFAKWHKQEVQHALIFVWTFLPKIYVLWVYNVPDQTNFVENIIDFIW